MAHIEVKTENPTPSPQWLKNAVIYELNPKTFTSPDGEGSGSGSGTFRSTKEKLEYLKELGVNTIWLAGVTQGSEFFSGFWTVYAMVTPEYPDEELGSVEELKELVNEAHKLGIRVIAEAVTHGVIFESPLVQKHPDWFRGSEWGMADFDYSNSKFRQWWIDLWIKNTIEFGFDGYRLDGPNGVSSFEQVLSVWDEIAWECRNKGHEIVIMGENSRYHIRQCGRDNFSHDMAADFSPNPQYATMQISCHDEGILMGEGNYYALRGSRFKFGYCAVFGYNIPLFMAGEEFNANVHCVSKLQKKIYDGFETSKEIDFYDDNHDTPAGGWLLGNRLNWSEIDLPTKKEMLEDCKKILRIRNENSDLLHYDRKATNILSTKCIPKSGSTPYIRYNAFGQAILVVGNEGIEERDFVIKIPLNEMGWKEEGEYKITNLWTNEIKIVRAKNMKCLKVTVPGDYNAGGGVRAYRIEEICSLM